MHKYLTNNFFSIFQYVSEQMDECQCHQIVNITTGICAIDSRIARMWMVIWS